MSATDLRSRAAALALRPRGVLRRTWVHMTTESPRIAALAIDRSRAWMLKLKKSQSATPRKMTMTKVHAMWQL